MIERAAAFALMAAVVSSSWAQAGSRSRGSKAEADSPALAQAQEQLRHIHRQQSAVLELYEKKQLDRDEAKAELQTLIVREKEITDDPGYQAELLLRQAARSKALSQESQAAWRTHQRMQKDLRKRLAAPSVR